MEANFTERVSFRAQMNEVVEVVRDKIENDHSKLTNRDAEDAHPISAITNLSQTLEKKMGEGDAITLDEIYKMIGE